MKEKMNLRGVVSTVITPFFEDKSIDFASYRREIDLGAKSDILGFLCPCNAMESAFMSEEELSKMVTEGVDAAAGRTYIISSILGKDSETRKQQCEQYMKAGANALCLNLPYSDDLTEEAYMQAVSEVDAFKPQFLLLQDTSVKDNGLPAEWIAQAFETFESVRGCKIEVQDSEHKYTKMIELTGGRMNVWGGFGNPATIEAYDRGCVGMMPSGLFELYSAVNKLYFEKSREAAQRLFYDFSPILLQLYAGSKLGNYFHKHYFKRVGVFSEVNFRKETFMDAYQQRICDEMIDMAIALKEKIPAYWK